MADYAELEIRSYVSEPDRGRRDWAGKADERTSVYSNRRRIRGRRGKRLLRKRGELIERSFAHVLETGYAAQYPAESGSDEPEMVGAEKQNRPDLPSDSASSHSVPNGG